MLGAIVDGIIGSEEETWIQYGVKWHRDDEYNAGIMTEEAIKEIAERLEYHGRWFGFNASDAIKEGIECFQQNPLIRSGCFEKYEIDLMRKDLIQRLIKRLHRYRNGRQLAVKDDGAVIWLRWE